MATQLTQPLEFSAADVDLAFFLGTRRRGERARPHPDVRTTLDRRYDRITDELTSALASDRTELLPGLLIEAGVHPYLDRKAS